MEQENQSDQTPQQLWVHGSDQTKGVSREGMNSNTENMRLCATSKKSRNWNVADRESNADAKQVDAVRKTVLS